MANDIYGLSDDDADGGRGAHDVDGPWLCPPDDPWGRPLDYADDEDLMHLITVEHAKAAQSENLTAEEIDELTRD